MKWAHVRGEDYDSKGWFETETPVGQFVVEQSGSRFRAGWWPNCAPYANSSVTLGHYCTQGAAKSACKRFCKRMAAAFKAMGKAGWQ